MNVAQRHASCRPVLCPVPEWRVHHRQLRADTENQKSICFCLNMNHETREWAFLNILVQKEKKFSEIWRFEPWLSSGQGQGGSNSLLSNQVSFVFTKKFKPKESTWTCCLLYAVTLWVKCRDYPVFEGRVFLGGAQLDGHSGKSERRGIW